MDGGMLHRALPGGEVGELLQQQQQQHQQQQVHT
jgi:hypothetical protein